MNPTHEDYDIVARYLDGERVQLTAAQQALAEEISADSELVGRALDVTVPGGVLHRVGARVAEALPGRRSRLRGFRWAMSAAAAAAVVLAVMLWPGRPGREPDPPITRIAARLSAAEYVEQFLKAAPDDLDAQTKLLAEEVADYHVQMLLGEASPLDMSLASVEDEIDYLGFDAEAEGPMEWDEWD